MSGLYHNPKVRFQRCIEIDCKLQDEDEERYNCPYCPPDSSSFSTFKRLMRHIEKSTTSDPGEEYDRQKLADGWYNAG
jgi:hypothetical protein